MHIVFVGYVLLLEVSSGVYKPVLCSGVEDGDRIHILHARGREGDQFLRTRYPASAVRDVLGVAPPEYQTSHAQAEEALETLIKAARRVRRRLSAHQLARSCQEGARYTLSELCQFAGVSTSSLVDRLAVAKVALRHPRLFVWQATSLHQNEAGLYALAPGWAEALMVPEDLPGLQRPDLQGIQQMIERFLGNALDLYRRSVNPVTGDITLAFHFPTIAAQQYAGQLAALAEEAGVTVTLTAQPHQGELANAARRLLPPDLVGQGAPSLYHGQETLQLKCRGHVPLETIAAAQEAFQAQTGWRLRIQLLEEPANQNRPRRQKEGDRLDQATAVLTAQQVLRGLSGFSKVGADVARGILLARFHFPEIASTRYAAILAQLEEQTGWQVQVPPGIHQQALAEFACRVLPEGLQSTAVPSVHVDRHAVHVRCKGTAAAEAIEQARETFAAETGWLLAIVGAQLLRAEDKSC